MRYLVSVVIVLFVVIVTALGQATTSRLDGTVKDPTGAAIPGATVTLTNIETGTTITTTTSELGVYVFPQVPAGYYRVTAQAPGFKKTVVDNVKVDVGIPTTVNFTLEVGELTEVVEVTASEGQALINTVNAELNTVVTRRQILDLPLNGRNPLQLAGLQAGVTTNTTVREASINGLRGSYTNVTQDGINIQDNLVRTDSLFGITAPSVDDTAEFSITTANAGENSGIGAVQVRLVTPSGGNEYHGSVFWFHRNTALNANSFFNNAAGEPREVLIRNQFGGRIGGPIFKDKLFFFTWYEGTREAATASRIRTVLTDQARRGIFRYRDESTGELQQVNLFELAGVNADPVISELIALTPLPNDFGIGDGLNTAGFRFNSGASSDDNLWGFRVDYEMRQDHHFEAIFRQFHSNFPNDVFNDIGEKFPGLPGGGQKSLRQLGSFAWRATWTPTMTNELRFGFQRAPVDFFNAEKFENGYKLAFPITTNPIQNFSPQGRTTPVYELIDNATWLVGNHNIRFGGHVRWVSSDLFNEAGIIPTYALGFGGGSQNPLSQSQFPGRISSTDFERASDIMALLGGFLETASQTFNVTTRTSGFVPGAREQRVFKQRFLSFYGGDTWRLRPNFTLNFGLRWEWHTVPTVADGLGVLPVGGVEGVLDPNGFIDFAGEGTGRSFFNNDLDNFAPNISLAWDPFGDGRTSIRAGYAISYVVDSDFTSVRNALLANGGLSQDVTITVSGRVSEGLPPIPTPEFRMPLFAAEQIKLDPTSGMYTINPNLQIPYVQQWTLSIEREIFRDTSFEIRYVGNRGTQLFRAIDLNQMRLPPEYLDDVRLLQAELMKDRDGDGQPDNRIPLSRSFLQSLQVFSRLANLGRTLLANSTVQTLIANGEAGELVFFMMLNRNSVFATEGVRIPATIGPDFFYPNPNILFGDVLGNFSWSTYHALQAEIRRRLSQGLYFQANYTFGKALTNVGGNTQHNFDAFLDIFRPQLEKRRPSYDVTHTFNANFIYELPFGPGRRFLSGTKGFLGRMLEGWQINGLLNWRSGAPISIISGRGTFNRRGRSDTNTAILKGLTIQQLDEMTGDFRLPDGTPVLFDPRLIDFTIDENGRAVIRGANPEFFQHPGLAEVGTLGLTAVSGPGFFNMDFSLLKRTTLRESVNLEFRAEFFNIFNHTNWAVGFFQDAFGNVSENISSPNFGRIVATYDPRIIQFAFRVNF